MSGHGQSWCHGLLEAEDESGPIHEVNDPNSVILENELFKLDTYIITSRIITETRNNRHKY
jgi:hypothetical protein